MVTVVRQENYPNFLYYLEKRKLLFTIKGDTLYSALSFQENREYDFHEKYSSDYRYQDAPWYKEARCYFYLEKIDSCNYLVGAYFRERQYKIDGETKLPQGQSKVGILNFNTGEWSVQPIYNQLHIFNAFLFTYSNDGNYSTILKKSNTGRYEIAQDSINFESDHFEILNTLYKIDSLDTLTRNYFYTNYSIYKNDSSQIITLGLASNNLYLNANTALTDKVVALNCHGALEFTSDSILFKGSPSQNLSLQNIPSYQDSTYGVLIETKDYNSAGATYRINDSLIILNSYETERLSDVPLADQYGDDSLRVLDNGNTEFVYPPPVGCHSSMLVDIKNQEILIADVTIIRVVNNPDGIPEIIAEYYELDENGTIVSDLMQKRYSLRLELLNR